MQVADAGDDVGSSPNPSVTDGKKKSPDQYRYKLALIPSEASDVYLSCANDSMEKVTHDTSVMQI